MTHIVVVGMGYAGIPCAALFADAPGFRVTGLQRRSQRSGWKIEYLNRGQSPIVGDEPGLAELIRRVALDKGTFSVTDDPSVVSEADVVLIDVQTPTDSRHVPDYTSLRAACQQIGQHLQPGTLVIVESTVAPGTTQHLVRPTLESASDLSAGSDFHLAFSFERVMPGKLLEYIVHVPRVVGGINPESTRRAVDLYSHVVQAPISSVDLLTAEMAKVVENAYRDVNIAFANEVALACERMGVDVWTLRELINARDDRQMHRPGSGVGGHCLPKDPWLFKFGVEHHWRDAGAVRHETAMNPEAPPRLELLTLARRINNAMPAHLFALVSHALAEQGRTVSESKVVVLGVSYLENAADTRNTPAVPLMRLLLDQAADVLAHDPYVTEHEWQLAWGGPAPVTLTSDLAFAADNADCLVVVTRHQAYVDLGHQSPSSHSGLLSLGKRMRTPLIVDGRNALSAESCASAGFIYKGIGK
jgi:UDP-N-acetyl-D-mannosaminuronic acid dehydrogenase